MHPSPNWAYGEAACLIDLDQKLLVFYFSTDVSYDMPLLEAYLRLLKYTWPGWDVRWAWHEFWDVARYVGYSEEDLAAIARQYQEEYAYENDMDYVMTHLLDRYEYEETTLSFKRCGATKVRMIDVSEPEHLLGRREDLEAALEELSEERVSLEYVPFAGLHLNYDTNEIHRWDTWGNKHTIVESGWDGWAIVDHKADYRTFLRVLGDAISIESRPETEYISQLRRLYVPADPYYDWPGDEEERFARFSEIMRQHAHDNPVPVMVPTELLVGVTWA